MRSSRRNITRFALLALFGLCVALTGCSRSSSVGGSSSSRAVKGRSEAEQLAVNVVIAGASAQAKELPDGGKEIAARTSSSRAKGGLTPKSTPRPGSPAVVRVRIKSEQPFLNEAEAEDDALTQACLVIQQQCAELDPPLEYEPSLGEIKEYLRKDSRTVRPPSQAEKEILEQAGMSGNYVYVEYDVEVSADQVRELRSQDRVLSGLRIVGGLLAASLAIFLFLRADEWTKGYLTRWLALAAVMLAGGTAAALIFI